MAWEQAFAIVPDELDGYFVSPEFCTFEVDQAQASTRYVAHLLAWSDFLASLTAASTGTNVRRRRLQPATFLAAVCPLPDLPVQRSIAAKLDTLVALSGPFETSCKGIEEFVASVRSVSFTDESAKLAPLSRILVKKSVSVAVERSEGYRTAGVRWYGEGLFEKPRLTGADIKAKTLYRISAGDLVYNRLFAWKGSFALAEEQHEGLVVSNEFPVFEVDAEAIVPAYLREWLSWPPTWAAAELLSSGGTPTSRNRLKVEDFLTMSIPLPGIDVQWKLADILSTARELLMQVKARSALTEALPKAARNEVFSKLV